MRFGISGGFRLQIEIGSIPHRLQIEIGSESWAGCVASCTSRPIAQQYRVLLRIVLPGLDAAHEGDRSGLHRDPGYVPRRALDALAVRPRHPAELPSFTREGDGSGAYVYGRTHNGPVEASCDIQTVLISILAEIQKRWPGIELRVEGTLLAGGRQASVPRCRRQLEG
jgi:hypothetical protein